MNKPSSTITAAFLAGMFVSAAFGTLNEFTEMTVSSGYVATITTLVSSSVGYFKRERVLKPEDLG